MAEQHYRAVVIGGGVVGVSVLYHLAKLGWTDVALVERSELTAGSTWHAAAGFHTLNGDPNVAALQKYTIDLYRDLEAETGLSCGLHLTGGINLAGTRERWEWLQSQWAVFQTIGNETVRLVDPDEIAALCPIVDVTGLHGGMYDTYEGHLDPSGTTHAYAAAARARGATILLHNRVLALTPTREGWEVVTEQGSIACEHVIDAGGLWARKVARMAGVDLPVVPMEHHYLVTERIEEVAALEGECPMMMDLEGFTYLRQEADGLLLGVYETDPRHWHVEGAPWDFGMRLLTPDLGRIEKELAVGLARYPCLEDAGIRTWVNGAFTFSPDGNPLVGAVPGVRNFWSACAVMAGFSQGGGVGLALAEWMVSGEPQRDVYGMDVARFGPWAANDGYLTETTRQFYARRFVMTYPNEELPAGRPQAVSALHRDLADEGAVFGTSWNLEIPRYFVDRVADPGFVETPTLRRSESFDLVGAEARRCRAGVGVLDTTAFSRYAVTGPGARDWLDTLLAGRLPQPGRIRLTPMLAASGRLMGDLTTTCWGDEEFWVMGSYYLRAWHLRWFTDHLPADGSVRVEELSDRLAGVSIQGPGARRVFAAVAGPAANDLRWLQAGEFDVGLARARVGRLSVTGERGYEFNVPAPQLPGLYRTLREAGEEFADEFAVGPLGYDALDSLRLEKSYGIWSREFTHAYTPGESGLSRFLDYDKPAFVGRDAALHERDAGARRRLVTLAVSPVDPETDTEAGTFDPIWVGERRVGFVTSGGYGHCAETSLALGYVDTEVVPDFPEPYDQVEISVIGQRRPATIVPDSPIDPDGERQRI